MKYKIVAATTWQELEAEVQLLLDQGWLLQGGVSSTSHSYHNQREDYWDSTWEYAQALHFPDSASGDANG
jgi:hypothetical protein